VLHNISFVHILKRNLTVCKREVFQYKLTYIQSHEKFSGLQVIHNTMQYKCTIGGVAVHQYAVVHCDIDS